MRFTMSVRSFSMTLAAGMMLVSASTGVAQRDRVIAPVRNADVVGTNANAFRAELRGLDNYYSWAALGPNGALLFNNANNAGQNVFVESFTAPNVVGSGQFMLFDAIVDKGAKIARKAEVGVALGPATLRIAGPAGRDVVTQLDPLNKAVRRAVNLTDGSTLPFEIVLENGSDESILVTDLSVRIDNLDDPYDFASPFVPDGPVATLDQPFFPTNLGPGDQLVYTYSGAFHPDLAISVSASSLVGADTFTGLLGTHVPEPSSLAGLGCATLFMLRRRRA